MRVRPCLWRVQVVRFQGFVQVRDLLTRTHTHTHRNAYTQEWPLAGQAWGLICFASLYCHCRKYNPGNELSDPAYVAAMALADCKAQVEAARQPAQLTS